MFNILIRGQKYLRTGLLILFFFNCATLDEVKAKVPQIQESNASNTNNEAANQEFNNIFPNSKPSNWENKIITQNLNPESVKILPNSNNPNRAELLYPQLKPNTDFNKPDAITQINPNTNQKNVQLLMLNALTNSASRYPWVIDPKHNITFSSSPFNPFKNTNYIDFSIKFSAEDPIVERFNFAHFPKQDQFYWVLPGNRIVVETKGWQTGILYQGESADFERRQTVRLTQRLWGMQAASTLPQGFEELAGEFGLNQFSIQSIAGELVNPQGIPAPPVQISNSGTANSSNITAIIPSTSTINADNPSLILQSFPTSNLQPLLGEVSLRRGSVISRANLEQAGFFWGNPLTGTTTQFQPPTTSTPGLKIGSREQFDNPDLFNILLNPAINETQRNLSYLNSLFWVSLGQRQNTIRTRDTTETQNWQKFYFSHPHNRTLLQYDALVNKVTYTNVYSNPGVSLSFSVDPIDVDQIQSANASLGMLIGGIFELINPPELKQSLQEAKELFSRQESFATLDSKSTSEQRRTINQTLNRTLFLGNRISGLEQISGNFSFPSTVTPNSSSILQIRTGNHRRAIQFIDGQRTWREGETFISRADISNNSFGGLTSVNVPVPSQQTSILPNNRSSALQVTLTNPDGQQFRQNLNSSDIAAVPVNIRSFDLTFDRIELSQNGRLNTQLQTYTGYLSLPTIEALWTGSSGSWNYSVNSGVWFNLNSNNAFDITNNFGDSEPTIGVYTNGLLNYIDTNVELNAAGETQAITSHVPALRFHWNSGSNFRNPNYINLSYSFFRQNKNRNNYSLATGIVFFDESSRPTQAGFFQGALELNSGLDLRTTLEIGDDFFYTLEGTQRVNSNWYVGGYLQNFRSIYRGINSRINDFSYGLLIKREIPNDGVFWESRLGMSGNIFEARFEGGFRF